MSITRHWTQTVLLSLLALLVAGCAGTRTVGRSTDEFRIEPGIANAAVSPAEPGIFHDADTGRLRVRVRNKGLVSVIDELAYKAGFNYTMLSDLSTHRVSIEAPPGVQVAYDNERLALDAIIADANRKLRPDEPKVHYRWVSDGPELFLSPAPPGDAGAERSMLCSRSPSVAAAECGAMTFKKMFFKNITADDALAALAGLFEPEVEAKSDLSNEELRLANRGKRAAIVPYHAQNAILVRGKDRSVYDRLAELLPSLDADFQLVLVETQVFEYDDSIARKIGVALDYSRGKLNSDPTKPEFRIATEFGEGITNALPQFFWNLSGTEKKATLLSKLAFYDREGLVRIMAEPRLTLKSGESAEVELAAKRYYITPGVNSPGDIRELPTGILFRVKPTVLGDDKILLKLFVRQSEFVPTNDATVAAATNDNRIETAVIARDGELVSLGGILTKRDSKFASGLPGLRKLPGVGFLFGSEAGDSDVTRVEFMIRPTVKRAAQRNDATLKNLRDANCRITRYMGKTTYECQDDQSTDQPVDLDAPAPAGRS